MEKKKLGFAMTGSFCTFERAIAVMRSLTEAYDVLPIMSSNAYETTTRFGKAGDIVAQVEQICGKSVIHTIRDAEPIGPRGMCDALVVAPCTGNTLSKLASGITDTPVTMAVKSGLRIGVPVVLAVATNDALGASAQNIGRLMNTKHIYFVPMSQDDPQNKPTSLVADFARVPDALSHALAHSQLRPVFI